MSDQNSTPNPATDDGTAYPLRRSTRLNSVSTPKSISKRRSSAIEDAENTPVRRSLRLNQNRIATPESTKATRIVTRRASANEVQTSKRQQTRVTNDTEGKEKQRISRRCVSESPTGKRHISASEGEEDSTASGTLRRSARRNLTHSPSFNKQSHTQKLTSVSEDPSETSDTNTVANTPEKKVAKLMNVQITSSRKEKKYEKENIDYENVEKQESSERTEDETIEISPPKKRNLTKYKKSVNVVEEKEKSTESHSPTISEKTRNNTSAIKANVSDEVIKESRDTKLDISQNKTSNVSQFDDISSSTIDDNIITHVLSESPSSNERLVHKTITPIPIEKAEVSNHSLSDVNRKENFVLAEIEPLQPKISKQENTYSGSKETSISEKIDSHEKSVENINGIISADIDTKVDDLSSPEYKTADNVKEHAGNYDLPVEDSPSVRHILERSKTCDSSNINEFANNKNKEPPAHECLAVNDFLENSTSSGEISLRIEENEEVTEEKIPSGSSEIDIAVDNAAIKEVSNTHVNEDSQAFDPLQINAVRKLDTEKEAASSGTPDKKFEDLNSEKRVNNDMECSALINSNEVSGSSSNATSKMSPARKENSKHSERSTKTETCFLKNFNESFQGSISNGLLASGNENCNGTSSAGNEYLEVSKTSFHCENIENSVKDLDDLVQDPDRNSTNCHMLPNGCDKNGDDSLDSSAEFSDNQHDEKGNILSKTTAEIVRNNMESNTDSPLEKTEYFESNKTSDPEKNDFSTQNSYKDTSEIFVQKNAKLEVSFVNKSQVENLEENKSYENMSLEMSTNENEIKLEIKEEDDFVNEISDISEEMSESAQQCDVSSDSFVEESSDDGANKFEHLSSKSENSLKELESDNLDQNDCTGGSRIKSSKNSLDCLHQFDKVQGIPAVENSQTLFNIKTFSSDSTDKKENSEQDKVNSCAESTENERARNIISTKYNFHNILEESSANTFHVSCTGKENRSSCLSEEHSNDSVEKDNDMGTSNDLGHKKDIRDDEINVIEQKDSTRMFENQASKESNTNEQFENSKKDDDIPIRRETDSLIENDENLEKQSEKNVSKEKTSTTACNKSLNISKEIIPPSENNENEKSSPQICTIRKKNISKQKLSENLISKSNSKDEQFIVTDIQKGGDTNDHLEDGELLGNSKETSFTFKRDKNTRNNTLKSPNNNHNNEKASKQKTLIGKAQLEQNSVSERFMNDVKNLGDAHKSENINDFKENKSPCNIKESDLISEKDIYDTCSTPRSTYKKRNSRHKTSIELSDQVPEENHFEQLTEQDLDHKNIINDNKESDFILGNNDSHRKDKTKKRKRSNGTRENQILKEMGDVEECDNDNKEEKGFNEYSNHETLISKESTHTFENDVEKKSSTPKSTDKKENILKQKISLAEQDLGHKNIINDNKESDFILGNNDSHKKDKTKKRKKSNGTRENQILIEIGDVEECDNDNKEEKGVNDYSKHETLISKESTHTFENDVEKKSSTPKSTDKKENILKQKISLAEQDLDHKNIINDDKESDFILGNNDSHKKDKTKKRKRSNGTYENQILKEMGGVEECDNDNKEEKGINEYSKHEILISEESARIFEDDVEKKSSTPKSTDKKENILKQKISVSLWTPGKEYNVNEQFGNNPKRRKLTLPKEVEEKIAEQITQFLNESKGSDSSRASIETANESQGFLDDMAEEGEESTPSEDSNEIPVRGESVGYSSSEEYEDDSYEKDSFIDDEEYELLSDEEYNIDSDVDSPGHKKGNKNVQCTSKKKWSRIITIKDSSKEDTSEEEIIDVDKETDTKHKNSESNVSNEEKDKIEDVGDTSLSPVIAASTLLRCRKSSIIVKENISVEDIKDVSLRERINKVVESFCTNNYPKGDLTLNVSLDYSPKTRADSPPKLKREAGKAAVTKSQSSTIKIGSRENSFKLLPETHDTVTVMPPNLGNKSFDSNEISSKTSNERSKSKKTKKENKTKIHSFENKIQETEDKKSKTIRAINSKCENNPPVEQTQCINTEKQLNLKKSRYHKEKYEPDFKSMKNNENHEIKLSREVIKGKKFRSEPPMENLSTPKKTKKKRNRKLEIAKPEVTKEITFNRNVETKWEQGVTKQSKNKKKKYNLDEDVSRKVAERKSLLNKLFPTNSEVDSTSKRQSKKRKIRVHSHSESPKQIHSVETEHPDMPKRKKQKISASLSGTNDMWNVESVVIKPSHRSNKAVVVSSPSAAFHPKDIRNRVMFDKRRVRRV